MMKKINWRKKKYILPAIAFIPCLWIGLTLCKLSQFEKPNEDKSIETENINTDLPDPNLNKAEIKSKYKSMLDGYGKVTEYTGVDNVEQEEDKKLEIENYYGDDEKKRIDSLNVIKQNEEKKLKDFLEKEKVKRERNINTSYPLHNKEQDEMNNNLRILQQIASGEHIKSKTEIEKEERDRKIKEKKKKIQDSIKIANQPINVVKVQNGNESHFNTVSDKTSSDGLIKARVDELVKVKDGSRLRIRLSEDIQLQNHKIEKGTYLYATVTGFTAQRVKAEISNIMVGGSIKNVSLKIYDLDCMEGFYVPQSTFRDFAKEAGSSAMNMNMNMNSNTGDQNVESMALQSLQQVIQSTTSALSKSIKKNSAKIKYNTEIYLVNDKNK